MGVDMLWLLGCVVPFVRGALILLQIADHLEKAMPIATIGGAPMQLAIEAMFAFVLSWCTLSMHNIVVGFGALLIFKWHINKQKKSGWFVDKMLFLQLVQAAMLFVKVYSDDPYAQYYK